MNKFLLLLLGLLIIAVSLSFGAFGLWTESDLSFNEKLELVMQLRFPRVLSSLLIGAILSCCGLLVQTLLKNPLACPYTLGISQVVALCFFAFIFLGSKMQILLLGIFLVTFIFIVAFTDHKKSKPDFSASTLVLAGLALGSFCSSLILALQFTLDGMSLLQISRWLMGSSSVADYSSLILLSLMAFILLIVIRFFRKDLDCMLLGNEIAFSRGVPVRSVNFSIHLTILACVAAVVWYAGPIGFVGLIIPHCVRLLGIKGHGLQAAYCAFAGGAFLCFCDLLSRVMFAPVEIPIGIVTGLIGAPCFIVLLIKERR